MQFEVFERQVGGVLERRDDLPRFGQPHFARELDDCSRDGVFGDHVHRDQAPERIGVLRSEVDRPFERVGQQRCLDLHGPDLRAVRTEVRTGQQWLGHFGVNVAVFTPGSNSELNSEKPVKPASPSEHASSPSAPAGLSATPSGSVTVVSRSADSARPSGLKAAFCETWTPTVNPDEVLASVVSGETVIVGGNSSFEHPVSASG